MAQLNMRIDEDLKQTSTKILEDLGLDLSGAVRVFLKQVVLQEGLPFDVKLNRPAIDEAIEDLENGNVKTFSSISDLMEDLKNGN
ncbi:DNA-damage-inducible protein J [Enterococcus sp. AZ150]|uniref:type II toxin-antitoxin system RelB/DinJ family antitoxin n=1 Tax=Enterococcus sp. AZ150 TaxID=2774866 RepID=UPI003F21556E